MHEVYILTTNLIKRCLYEQSGLDSYISTLNGVSIEEFVLKYYDNSKIIIFQILKKYQVMI